MKFSSELHVTDDAANKLGRFEGARSVPGASRKVQEQPGGAQGRPGAAQK